MTFHDSNKELFKKLSEEHEKAQIAAKQAERYNDALPVPPLKELRDVLHHVILSLTLSPKDQEAELHKAISHCKRAYFDSKECIFQYLINNVEAIKEKMGVDLPILKDFIPDYPTHKKNINDAKNFAYEINGLDKESRQQYYEECDPHIKNLESFIQDYSNLEEEILIAKQQKEEERADRKASRKYSGWNIATAIISFFAGILCNKLF